MGARLRMWALTFVCGCIVIVHHLSGVASWAVGIGGGSLMWHLAPVGVNEIEWEGEVSTYCGR